MINFQPFSPKALDFLQNSDARLNILDGSVRSSKTVNCTVRWLIFLAEGPPGDLLMSGKTVGTLERNVLNDIYDIVGKQNFKWLDKQKGVLQLMGRRVYCVGACNEESESKLRGATFAGALCDEVNLYPQSFFDMLMSRLSLKGSQCFCNCNPDGPFHWFYLHYIMNDTIKNKKRWQFRMEDNLSLDPEYVESLKQMYTGVFYRRFIDGEWCIAEGAIYDMFGDRCIKALPEDEKIIRYLISCDYGTSTVMSWSKIGLTNLGNFYKVEEYYYSAPTERQQKTDSQFGEAFVEFIKGITPYGIYCDPSAASWKAELRSRGLNPLDADNDVINGIRVVGSLLTRGKYFVSPTCVNTIKEYQTYAWDPTAQKSGVDKPLKTFDHSCDSDRYALYTYAQFSKTGIYSRR